MSDPHEFSSDEKIRFRELIRRASEGSEDAVWELVRDFGEDVRRAVRRGLHSSLQSKFDSVDFAQLMWLSLIRRGGDLKRFEEPKHFVAYITTMACNKLRMETRRQRSQRHDVRREVPLDPSCSADEEEMVDRKPSPVDVAIARERLERLLQDQPRRYRQIIELKLQGNTAAEIAAILKIDCHTVNRFLKKLLLATIQ